jgi:hypothetical protein
MQFAANVFLQVFKQSQDLYHAAILAMILDKVGSISDIDDIIDGLYNKDVTEEQFKEILKNTKAQA